MKPDRIQIVNTMLYILNKAGSVLDFHKIFKIMYFAECKHLSEYGRMITDDDYIKMENGPVPSVAYDILKEIRNFGDKALYSDKIKVSEKYKAFGIGRYDEDEFSVSDMECLDEAFDENIGLSFNELTDKSHDYAWHNAVFSLEIEDMAKANGSSDEMLRIISEIQEIKKSSFFAV